VNSGNATNVVEAFVKACERRGIRPGLYYSSYDNHHRWGSRTRSDFPSKEAYFARARSRPPFGGEDCGREDGPERMPYTTSLYQSFQTTQITELLTEYGKVMEFWIDHPDALGRGYRTFLYHHIAGLQPDIVVMMNNGTPGSEDYDIDYAWPSDLIAMEEGARGGAAHDHWRTIEGREYYLPAEACDSIAPIRQDWFHLPGDEPRPVDDLARQFRACRDAGINYLLNVPPDRHGLIPDEFVQTLTRLRAELCL
jgi:alpha-L-fucosidase